MDARETVEIKRDLHPDYEPNPTWGTRLPIWCPRCKRWEYVEDAITHLGHYAKFPVLVLREPTVEEVLDCLQKMHIEKGHAPDSPGDPSYASGLSLEARARIFEWLNNAPLRPKPEG